MSHFPITVLILVATCASCSATQDPKPAPHPSPRPPLVRHAALDRILRATVRAGLVDYAALRAEHSAALQAYLAELAGLRIAELTRPEQLATYLNLYNATMLHAVLEKTAHDRSWTPASEEFAVFKEARVKIASETLTLDQLEHEILRKQWREPRIHVALVCGARSCPILLPRAYEAADLEATLEANLKRFLLDPQRNRVDRAGKTLHLSALLQWFGDDFGGEAGVRALCAKYLGSEVQGFAIRYLDYDWKLNAAPVPTPEKSR